MSNDRNSRIRFGEYSLDTTASIQEAVAEFSLGL